MRNESQWMPTKFRRGRGGRWRASRDPEHLTPASRLYANRMIVAYERVLKEYARGDLADLGCGTVPLYGVYKHVVSSVVCADWSGTSHTTSHLDFELDLSQPLDALADGSFDTVLLSDVLEHLPNPEQALTEVHRILRPGGVLILGVPFMYGLHEVPHDYHRYTEHLLRLRLEVLGHEVLHLQPLGGPAEVVFDVVGRVLAGAGAPQHIVSVEQDVAWGISRAIPSAFRRRADPLFPTGYVVVSRRPDIEGAAV